MNSEKSRRQVKYPENKKIAEKLQPGDRAIIAKYSKLATGTVNDIMYGYRRITDNVARAIIRLMKEREEIMKGLEEIINN